MIYCFVPIGNVFQLENWVAFYEKSQVHQTHTQPKQPLVVMYFTHPPS